MKVVYSASRNLYPYLYPSIISLLEHNDVERIYLLLEDDRFPNHLPALPPECVIYNVTEQKFFDKNGPNFRTRFTYLSLLRTVYSLMFKKLDKIIQLDVDTIVTDSLKPIWDIDISDSYFAAVREPDRDNGKYGAKYYNIGVAVFNLDKIRKDGIDLKAIELLNTNRYSFIDQDVWNILGSGTAVELDPRYNENRFTGITNNPAVVHFAGYKRWWNDTTMFRYEYLKKYLGTFDEVTDMINKLKLDAIDEITLA